VVPFHDRQVDPSPHWLPLDRLDEIDLLHCDVRWPEGAHAALKAAHARGIATMVDGDVAPRDILQQLMPLADYAVFSDAGLLAYTGMHDVPQALLHVAQQHSRHVGASCGADGYYWVENGHIEHVGAPQVEVVDTLAAGDVFHGAFALAVLEGQDTRSAARFACVAASLKCTQFGGRLGCPTRAEVEAELQKTG
jgi:sulfofructose kinase